MLKQGDSGERVEGLQRRLGRAGFDPGPVDGVFGPKTDAAVRALQAANDLQVDGIFGPASRKAMKALLADSGEAAPAPMGKKPADPGGERPARKIADRATDATDDPADSGGVSPL